MIRDLNSAKTAKITCDVLVIGAGTVGLLLAVQLSDRGLSVVCIESGDISQEEETHPLNRVEYGATHYAGAEHGRFRCLGGTSTRWGGAMIPFQAADINNANWPVSPDEINKHLLTVEKLFDLPDGNYDAPETFNSPDFLARLAKWPSFSKRNVANLLDEKIKKKNGPEIWINATATDFLIQNGKLHTVKARSIHGATLTVQAEEFIFAAGAIESTRLLLLLDRQNDGFVNAITTHLGHHFYDHLSAAVADLEVYDRKSLNRVVGFHFAPGGAMRNLRFELSEGTSLRTTIPPCFAHVAFQSKNEGFDSLRDVFRSIQRRRFPELITLVRLLKNAPWLARAVWWRLKERRLLYPSDASIKLHMVIEQAPAAGNKITLSANQIDIFGQPLARIDWQVQSDDQKNLNEACDAFEKSWHHSSLSQIARLHRRTTELIETDLERGGGIYHPGGSTRMGKSPAEGVVDNRLRVFGIPNLRVTSTSVLPTGGGANPTMMLIMLALLSIDELSNR